MLTKPQLKLLTGIVWLFAASVLFARAISWFSLLTQNEIIIGIVVSFIIAFVKGWFVFRKLNLKNIIRIENLEKGRVHLLNFHAIKDQLIIVIMIITGMVLRNLTFISKSALMPVYLGVSIAMVYVFTLYVKSLIVNRNRD